METTVTTLLKQSGIPFEVKPHSQSVYTCEDAARERGCRVSQIVKCMIGKDGEGRLHVMLVPGDKKLKIKKARQVAGGIRIDLVTPAEMEALGLTAGAISPIQLIEYTKYFYIDRHILREEHVSISSGDPKAGVELRSEDLVSALNGTLCDIISTGT